MYFLHSLTYEFRSAQLKKYNFHILHAEYHSLLKHPRLTIQLYFHF